MDRMEEAHAYAAHLVARHDASCLPMFERLDQEVDARRQPQLTDEFARHTLEVDVTAGANPWEP